MSIIGITRIRNEAGIIENTLNHVSSFLDSVYVVDDASEDNTVEICENHPIVKKVITNLHWDGTTEGRNKAEGSLRQLGYEKAMEEKPDWIYYFDADEYAELIENELDPVAPFYYLRLFDFYITEEDKDKGYLERQWIGPEFRDIPMIFNTKKISWYFKQRIPIPATNYIGGFGGYVRHYGKAISVEEWEKDVEYYSQIRWNAPIYAHLQKRWLDRKGKAIHDSSDFGRKLIKWEDRNDYSKIVRL